MKTVFTLEEVKAAFETLVEYVAKSGADAGCTWTIHAAAEDVLSILSGEWAASVSPIAPEEGLWRHEDYITGQVEAEARAAGDAADELRFWRVS